MSRRILSYVLGAVLLAASAYAQDKEEKKPSGQVTAESGTAAPWYNVKGPRINFNLGTDAGNLSGAYVPINENAKNGHDFHVMWEFPKFWQVTAKPVFEHSHTRGSGGGAIVTNDFGSFQISSHGEVFGDGTKYGEVKLLSKHFDVDAGLKKDGNARGYGYVTTNFGSHDDTVSLGYAPDGAFWNSFSFGRNRWGTLSMSGYNPGNGYWTTDTFIGVGDITKFWYDRNIDRLVISNNVNPKERSFILAIPSYLTFGNWSGEFRAEKSNEKTFANISAGRTFTKREGKLKGAKFGLGSGVEYASRAMHPSGEILLEVPFYGYIFSVQKRIRNEEGNFYVLLGRKF